MLLSNINREFQPIFCLFFSGVFSFIRHPVKTHDSLPRGADRLETTNGRESTAATSLPEIDRGSKCPVVAHSTGNNHELRIPAAKAGCALLRTRQRLATDIWHSWVKQVSPQSACML